MSGGAIPDDPGIGSSVRLERLDELGRELLDPTPMAPPIGYKRQPSLVEQIRKMVRDERLAADLAASGVETFEEADDFDVQDDYDPKSPFEYNFDPPVEPPKAAPPAPEAPPAPPEGPKASDPPAAPSAPAEAPKAP